jgi:hypothetical protein
LFLASPARSFFRNRLSGWGERPYTPGRSQVKPFACSAAAESALRRTMRTQLTRQPGQPGTKRLVAQYGAELLCVRYRYDEAQRKRFKTVELMVEECDWHPAITATTIVGVQVALQETAIQRNVRQAGGRWNPTRRVGEIRYDRAKALGLKNRIVSDEVSISRNKKASINRN